MLDDFSLHQHPNVRVWAAADDVELVFLPTYGSWLNWIESEFAALRYFALNGADHPGPGEQEAALTAYIHWRSARAEPKTGFASDSPIRSSIHYPERAGRPLGRARRPARHRDHRPRVARRRARADAPRPGRGDAFARRVRVRRRP
ncbi:transposase [Kitasatospora sp. NPDC001603]|uniref:transposase n=1 Tax=Kitasatospora sp. NPDC001603 TaxID=3154388 RepID=UPI00331DAA9F